MTKRSISASKKLRKPVWWRIWKSASRSTSKTVAKSGKSLLMKRWNSSAASNKSCRSTPTASSKRRIVASLRLTVTPSSRHSTMPRRLRTRLTTTCMWFVEKRLSCSENWSKRRLRSTIWRWPALKMAICKRNWKLTTQMWKQITRKWNLRCRSCKNRLNRKSVNANC